MDTKKIMRDGLIDQNPVLIQLLGMCSVLAITTTLFNGIGMGLSVTVILTCSNVVIALLRKIIPNEIRIACYIVVIASFVTIVQLLLKALLPALDESLGVFIPLIVVNCIILGRAEAFASKNSVGAAALDGVFQGLGYTWALVVMCVVRELLGNGTIAGGFSFINNGDGIRVLPESVSLLGMILPVGGFLTLGCFIAFMQWRSNKAKEAAKSKKEEVTA